MPELQPHPDEDPEPPLVVTPKLVLACVIGIAAVALVTGALLASVFGGTSIASQVAQSTPTTGQVEQLLKDVTKPSPVPVVATPDPRTPIVGTLATPGAATTDGSSSSGAGTTSGTPTTAATPATTIRGGAPAAVPTVDLGLGGAGTGSSANAGLGSGASTSSPSPSFLGTPQPTVAPSLGLTPSNAATPSTSTSTSSTSPFTTGSSTSLLPSITSSTPTSSLTTPLFGSTATP